MAKNRWFPRWVTILTLALMGGLTTMADEQPNDWKKIKEEAEAEKAALDALRALEEARKGLADAQAPVNGDDAQLNAQVKAAQAAKTLADAEKAAADARKAEADAALAAFKAKIGEVPASGYTGDVTLKDKAGATEATLLASKAVEEAADRLATDLSKHLKEASVVLYSAAELPSFDALLAFGARVRVVEGAFAEAQRTSSDADTKAPEPAVGTETVVPVAAAAGLTLDAVNKLLGYFKTDYTVGGISLEQDDSLLIHALAGRLKGRVRLLGTYDPAVLSTTTGGPFDKLTSLSTLKSFASQKAEGHARVAALFTKQAQAAADAPTKKAMGDKALLHTRAEAALKSAVSVYDSFFTSLTTAEAGGAAPLTDVLRQSALSKALMEGAKLLVVKLQSSGGSYYTRKNMWTFFGGMPFFHMGGVVASYVLIEGEDGHVIASDVVAVHGGFVRAGKVRDHLASSRHDANPPAKGADGDLDGRKDP